MSRRNGEPGFGLLAFIGALGVLVNLAFIAAVVLIVAFAVKWVVL